MAKKAAEPITTLAVRLDLTPDVHSKLRVAAALSGQSMSSFAKDAVTAAAEKVLQKQGKTK